MSVAAVPRWSFVILDKDPQQRLTCFHLPKNDREQPTGNAFALSTTTIKRPVCDLPLQQVGVISRCESKHHSTVVCTLKKRISGRPNNNNYNCELASRCCCCCCFDFISSADLLLPSFDQRKLPVHSEAIKILLSPPKSKSKSESQSEGDSESVRFLSKWLSDEYFAWPREEQGHNPSS